MKEVVIINYGSGNIFSVSSALQKLGYRVKVTSLPEDIIKADFIILPGVGAYKPAINKLINMNIDEALSIFIKRGGLLIGICLGYQLLFEESKEFGDTPGLGILKGRVVSLSNFKDDKCKVPNIGWRPLIKPSRFSYLNYKDESMAYFVHSFIPVSLDKEIVSSYIQYGKNRIHTSIHNGQIVGFQFHPEKSRSIGLNILDSAIKDF
jgi:glutamine amidotransferase